MNTAIAPAASHHQDPTAIPARQQAEQAALLRKVFDTTPECIKIVAPDGTLTDMNAAGLRMVGACDPGALIGRSVFTLIAPEDLEDWRARHARVCQGESLAWSFAIIGLDGCRRQMETHAAPLVLPDGTTGQLAVTRDVTERHRLQHALETRAAALRDLLNAIPAAIYTTDARGRLTFFNQACISLAGREPRIGEDEWCVSWRLYHTDGRRMPHDECPMALSLKSGENVRGREAFVEKPDGGRVLVLPYPTVLRNESGALTGAVNMLIDMSEREQAERRKQLLINELNHRVKNTLATVQAIATHSFRGAAERPARQWFEGRLLALSRAHEVLTKENWEGASLMEIAAGAVAPHRDRRGNRFTIEGPELRLPPRLAVSLAMCLHELCTNAAKHGALRGEQGHVSIGWEVEQARLTLRWVETGGPPVEPPRRKGFGSRLISRGLAHEFGGSADLVFESSGLVCTIRVPLP